MTLVFLDSFMCPHCHTKCSFFGDGLKNSSILYCTGCKNDVYFKLKNSFNIEEKAEYTVSITTKDIVDYYPRLVPNIDPSIPQEIAEDYKEAIQCENIPAPKATVTMCRRVMQNACILKGANSKKDLIDQIDELESMRIINPTMKDIAHAIRMIGNWGAHPQTDPLKIVTAEDSSELLSFTTEFLNEVFVRPNRIKGLKTRKGIK